MKAIIQNKSFELQKDEENIWQLSNNSKVEIHHITPVKKLLFLDGRKFEVTLLQTDKEAKTVLLQVNQNRISVDIKSPLDDLLHKMGLDSSTTQKAQDIKAPMPGLVLDILVAPGNTIKKGDKVLVLEAMKMENVIKAAGDGVVKRIGVSKSQAVDKGQILVEME